MHKTTERLKSISQCIDHVNSLHPGEISWVDATESQHWHRLYLVIVIVLSAFIFARIVDVWLLWWLYKEITLDAFWQAFRDYPMYAIWQVLVALPMVPITWLLVLIPVRARNRFHRNTCIQKSLGPIPWPFGLYLRSFEMDRDDKLVYPFSIDEHLLVSALNNTIQLVALANSSEPSVTAGIPRLITTHKSWRDAVRIFSQNARTVIIDCRVRTSGLTEEIYDHLNPELERCSFCLFYVQEVNSKSEIKPLDIHELAQEISLDLSMSGPPNPRTVGYIREYDRLYRCDIPASNRRRWPISEFAKIGLAGTVYEPDDHI